MFPVRGREEIVLDIFESASSGLLLDIGCGDGDLTVRIGEACDTEAFYGVDVDAEAVERSKSAR